MNSVKINTNFGEILGFEDDLITNNLINYGAQQRNDLAMILRFLRSGDTVVDIGAHIGTIAIPLAIAVGKNGFVYAYEGDPETFKLLAQNITKHCPDNAHAINAIVTGHENNLFLLRNKNNTGANRFSKVSGISTGVPLFGSWDMFNKNKVNFIKIDVEGMDIDILYTFEKVLATQKPIVYIEMVKTQLEKYGYSYYEANEIFKHHGYHLFRNVGERNSRSDSYCMELIDDIHEVGLFADILAIHKNSERYPEEFKNG